MIPSLERHPGQTGYEQQAQTTLQPFLRTAYEAIIASRVMAQARGMKAVIGEKEQVLLMEVIEEKSAGRLRWSSARLCQITENGHVSWSHEKEDFADEPWFIRGFYFAVALEGKDFECIVLDHGIPERNVREKSAQERRRIMEKFASRRRGSIIRLDDLPIGFVALMRDNGENLEIVECVAAYDDYDKGLGAV